MQKYERFKFNQDVEKDINSQVESYLENNERKNREKREVFAFSEPVPFGVEKIINETKGIKSIFRNGENFDSEAELAVLRRLPCENPADRNNFKIKLKEIKEKIVEQKIGLAEIEDKIFKIINIIPEATKQELMEIVSYLARRYALNERQLAVFEDTLEQYESKHRAIKKIVADCTGENKVLDNKLLFKKVFGKESIGDVMVKDGPMIIDFQLRDTRDYAFVHSDAYVENRDVNNEDIDEARKSGGCFLTGYNLIPKLKGTIVLENKNNFWHYANDKTYQHEARHVYNHLVDENIRKHFRKPEEFNNWLGRDEKIEKRAKDEMIAFIEEGYELSGIRKVLLEGNTIYDYGHYYKKETHHGFSKQYTDLIDNGLNSFRALLENGFSRKDAQNILFKEDLSKWPKVVRRILKDSKHLDKSKKATLYDISRIKSERIN